MKRAALFTLLVSSVFGLATTASYAQVLDPGCSPQVMTMLEDQAQAMRVRNRAYERELINREESTLYLTCFDQALALSARLGFVFSDNVPPDPPPANTVVFTAPLAFPDWGATHPLAIDLDNAISPELDNQMSANFLPAWPATNALTSFINTGGLKAAIAAIKNFQANENPPASDYLTLVKQIDTLVNTFPGILLPDLPDAVTKYNDLITKLDKVLKDIDDDRKSHMTPLLAQLKTAVFNSNMNCSNLDDAWDKYNATSDFYPPEGNYYKMTPYYTLTQMLNGPRANATAAFTQELTFGTNTGVLNQAWNDLSTGPFSQAGTSPLWPSPPIFGPNPVAQDIIQQM